MYDHLLAHDVLASKELEGNAKVFELLDLANWPGRVYQNISDHQPTPCAGISVVKHTSGKRLHQPLWAVVKDRR